jgi:hypothetical protein
MVYVFVLLLENRNFYIGTTNHHNFKIEHLSSMQQPDWIKIHKPIRVQNIIPNCTVEDADKYTLKYMKKYGMLNVRGGSYSSHKLDEPIKNKIKKMIETKILNIDNI